MRGPPVLPRDLSSPSMLINDVFSRFYWTCCPDFGLSLFFSPQLLPDEVLPHAGRLSCLPDLSIFLIFLPDKLASPLVLLLPCCLHQAE